MLNRREFIKTTLIASASAAVTPVAEALAKAIDVCPTSLEDAIKGQADKDVHFHLIDNNLLNIHFYFLNVKRHCQGVTPGNDQDPSFMIVRLPQQHISEAGFWDQDWKDPSESKRRPEAMLSGFSYLAFRIWPPIEDNCKRQRYLELNVENLLDWNRESTFQLITLVDWLELKQAGDHFIFKGLDCKNADKENKTPGESFEGKKKWTTNNLQSVQLGATEPTSEIFRRYKSIINTLFDANAKAKNDSFIPVTFFEVPHEVCLVPLIRKQQQDPERLTHKARFRKNVLSPNPSRKSGKRKYEVWNNTLLYERIQSAEQPTAQQFIFETPSFRVAGLITDKKLPCPTKLPECSSDPTKPDKKDDILPTLLDKMELAYLTQFAKDGKNPATGDRTDPEFDIKEVNGFFFTGLGAITHLKYATQKHLPDGIDLIEYEHRITEGRDVFIKVARLGYNSKTGQKYKHVIEGTRKITTEPESKGRPPRASFIELKQYCECIEPEIDYTKHIRQDGSAPDWSKQMFIPYRDSSKAEEIAQPIFGRPCHYRRNPFRFLKNTDTKRVPISCLKDKIISPEACELERLEWFWVIKERPEKNPNNLPVQDSEVPIEDYVSCHYEATDWEGVTHSASTPFMFIRGSYIERIAREDLKPDAVIDAYDNYLRGTYAKMDPRDPLVERRLTHFNGKAIAFTPTPKPQSGNSNSDDPVYDSKTNVLETDYFESYFMIKNTVHGALDPEWTKSLNEKHYVIFPQVLRARVYLDHIRDMAQQKIPSIVEFHQEYVDLGLETDSKNYGKLILRHTDAYRKGHEESQNNTFNTIKTALQQAKNELGNLAVPDIVPEVISLDRSGITLPDKLQNTISDGLATFDEGTKRLKAISPRAILRGQLSEILGGIDLTAILDELLPLENSPQFELTKLANELEKVEQSILDSPVYKEILQELKDSKRTINDAIAEVNVWLAEVKKAQTAVNNALQKISREVPNVDELDSLIKNLFEQYRMQAFKVLLDDVAFEEVEGEINKIKKEVVGFRKKELEIIKFECQSKKAELDDFFKSVSVELDKLPSNLRQISVKDLSGKIIIKDLEVYFRDEITKRYEYLAQDLLDKSLTIDQQIQDLFQTVAEQKDPIKAKSRVVYYKVRKHGKGSATEWELTERPIDAKPLTDLTAGAVGSVGYVQLKKKIEDFRALVTGNHQSTSEFHKEAVAELLHRIDLHEQTLADLKERIESSQKNKLESISKVIREWNDAADKYRQGPYPPETKEIVRRIQELFLKGNAYVDFLRKADPYYYFLEHQRLEKDIKDIKKRFVPDFAKKIFSVETEVHDCVHEYERVREELFAYANDPKNNQKLLAQYVAQFGTDVRDKLSEIKKRTLNQLIGGQEVYKALEKVKDEYVTAQREYEKKYKDYLKLLGSQAEQEISKSVQAYITDKEKRLRQEIDPDTINTLQARIAEARNVYRALTSIKQQDLTYKWSTTQFRDANLGILTFKKGSAPDTKLDVDVRVTTHFTPGKFPPAIDRVETLATNRLTNFGVGFFNVLTVSFSEVSFQARSGQSPQCDVKIKDVKFDGAFAFVQEFEKWMAGKGLFLNVASDHLQLGYSLPIPAIQTPAFSFFNLTLNFDIRLHFDNRPMRFGFSFARPDLKFGIAAGIYAGFGFFGLVGDPKRGIIEMDAALEAGAWKGISIGPISGEVKLAFGFRYTRTEASVRLEGYICAEGRLSVWIIEVSARLYLGIVSENSYVEGQCTVTYSAKLGFISKSFSGTFHQRIAGAKSKNSEAQVKHLMEFHHILSSRLLRDNALSALSGLTKDQRARHEETVRTRYSQILRDYESQEVTPETAAVSRNSWKRFTRIM